MEYLYEKAQESAECSCDRLVERCMDASGSRIISGSVLWEIRCIWHRRMNRGT